jgi:hypothetical protein
MAYLGKSNTEEHEMQYTSLSRLIDLFVAGHDELR